MTMYRIRKNPMNGELQLWFSATADGVSPVLVETFVDTSRFTGVCLFRLRNRPVTRHQTGSILARHKAITAAQAGLLTMVTRRQSTS